MLWQRSSHDIAQRCVAVVFVISCSSCWYYFGCVQNEGLYCTEINPLYLHDEWGAGFMWNIWPDWNCSRASCLHWWSNRGSTDLLVPPTAEMPVMIYCRSELVWSCVKIEWWKQMTAAVSDHKEALDSLKMSCSKSRFSFCLFARWFGWLVGSAFLQIDPFQLN